MSLNARSESLVDLREQEYLNKKNRRSYPTDQIRNAYKNKDGAASRIAHMQLINNIHDHTNKEHTKRNLDILIKRSLFSASDALISLFAIVASSSHLLNSQMIFILGLSKLIADSISMAIADYSSVKTKRDFTYWNHLREHWEFENYEEGERLEMIEIYQDKGFTQHDATLIINTMSKYRDFFIEHMMMEELNLNPNIINQDSRKYGLATFLSFLLFGIIPLLSYLLFFGISTSGNSTDWRLIISIILTSSSLFGVGVLKGHYYKNNNLFKSGLFFVLNGVIAGSSAYLISYGLTQGIQ